MFAFGLRAAARASSTALSHGKDENILLVTLGISIVLENLALLLFKSDTRTIETPYTLTTVAIGPAHDRAAQAGGVRRRAGDIGGAAADPHAAPTSAARSARWRRRSRCASSWASTSITSTR